MLNRCRCKSITDTCIYILPIFGYLQYQHWPDGPLMAFTFVTNHVAFLASYENDICKIKSWDLGDMSFAELTQEKSKIANS